MRNNMIKRLIINLVLLFICSVGVVIVLVREFNHGLLSPIGLRNSTLILGIGMSMVAVLIIMKSARNHSGLSKTAGEASLGKPPREHRRSEVRLAKLSIIFLMIFLFWGLHSIKKETLLPTLVGVTINLSITVILIRWVLRQKKNMN